MQHQQCPTTTGLSAFLQKVSPFTYPSLKLIFFYLNVAITISLFLSISEHQPSLTHQKQPKAPPKHLKLWKWKKKQRNNLSRTMRDPLCQYNLSSGAQRIHLFVPLNRLMVYRIPWDLIIIYLWKQKRSVSQT